MAAVSSKNYSLSPSASDLGLGDVLTQQVQDETEEQRRRRLLQQQMQAAVNPMSAGAAGALGLALGRAY
jgi:hypothetical protein